jgi:hypothetical protein
LHPILAVSYGPAKIWAIPAVLLGVALVGGFLFAAGASLRITRQTRKQQTAPTAEERQRAANAIADIRRKSKARFSVLLGADGRLSTSKTIAAAWTAVVAYILLALIIGWPDDHWSDALKNLSPTYLLLLGGPYASLVLSKGIVNGKVVGGSVQKPPGDNDPRLSDLIAGDSGQVDLFDAQYVLFNLIAMAYVIDAFVRATLSSGFPSIPTGLALLTGGPAAVYVANKAFSSNPPTISSVVPPALHPGDDFRVFGQNFAPDLLPGAGPAANIDPVPGNPVAVTVGGREATVIQWTTSQIDAKAPVPATAPTAPLDVIVTTSAGATVVQASALTVLPPRLTALDKSVARAGDVVKLTGSWGDPSTLLVLLNGVAVDPKEGAERTAQELTIEIPALPGPFPVDAKVSVVQGTQSSQELPLKVVN